MHPFFIWKNKPRFKFHSTIPTFLVAKKGDFRGKFFEKCGFYGQKYIEKCLFFLRIYIEKCIFSSVKFIEKWWKLSFRAKKSPSQEEEHFKKRNGL